MSEEKTTNPGKENKRKQQKNTTRDVKSSSDKAVAGKRRRGGINDHDHDTESREQGGAPPAAPPAETQATSRAAGGNKGGGFLAILALLLAVGGLAAGYKLWQKNQDVDSQLQARSAQLENRLKGVEQKLGALEGQVGRLARTSQDIQPRLDALRKDLEGKLTALGQKNKQQIDQQFSILQDSLNTLQAKLKEKKPQVARMTQWAPAEAEYLIRIADDSLRFRHDVAAALAALRAADQRLQAVGHPAFATTRRLLAEEINALLAVPQPDVSAVAATLAGLQARVTALPLKGGLVKEEAPPTHAAGADGNGEKTPEAEGWRAFFSDLWQALKELVTVRRRDVTDEPLMTPGQVQYLTQNLQLKLETARLALLRGDEATYHGALKAARQWIDRYYATEDGAVKETLAALQQLDGIELTPELPSVKPSLEAIQEVLASRDYLSARLLPPHYAVDNHGQSRSPAAAMTAKGGEPS